jgi:hypothetical protein
VFKSRWTPRTPKDTPAVTGSQHGSRSLNPADVAIAAGILAVTGGVGVQAALHFRGEAAQLDRHRLQSLARARVLRANLKHLEARRVAVAQLRRDVDRYTSEVASRPLVPWTTVVGELSRRRPRGLWTTEISGDGPRFRVQVTAARPDLAQSYTLALRESPYVDYAGLPPGQVSARTQVTGRWTGD